MNETSEPVKRYYDSKLGTFVSGDKPLNQESPNKKNLKLTTTNYGKKSGEPHICNGCLKPIEIGQALYSLHQTKESKQGLTLHFTKHFHDLICFEVWDKSDGII